MILRSRSQSFSLDPPSTVWVTYLSRTWPGDLSRRVTSTYARNSAKTWFSQVAPLCLKVSQIECARSFLQRHITKSEPLLSPIAGNQLSMALVHSLPGAISLLLPLTENISFVMVQKNPSVECAKAEERDYLKKLEKMRTQESQTD